MHDHTYSELHGRLDLSYRPAADQRDRVVLSSISHGGHVCTQAAGIGIKYVARGTEYYSFGGRTHAVGAGQFLCVAQSVASQVEVKRTGTDTLGLCLFVREALPTDEPDELLQAPLIFSDRCSRLGAMLAEAMTQLQRPVADRPMIAAELMATVRSGLDQLVAETFREFTSLRHAKPSTRFEALRRLHRARGFLHEVTDRPIELAELAGVCGISRFQLLRQFRECFGQTPAGYHRDLRLGLAREAMLRDRLSCGEIAYRFGFASAESFSHAHRRHFGTAPSHAWH